MNEVVSALSALAHAGRLNAFRRLVQAGSGGLAAGDLARQLDMAPNTLSASLTILAHAGLVQGRRDGRSIIYTARYAEMTALIQFLIEDCCAGSAEVCTPLGWAGCGAERKEPKRD